MYVFTSDDQVYIVSPALFMDLSRQVHAYNAVVGSQGKGKCWGGEEEGKQGRREERGWHEVSMQHTDKCLHVKTSSGLGLCTQDHKLHKTQSSLSRRLPVLQTVPGLWRGGQDVHRSS